MAQLLRVSPISFLSKPSPKSPTMALNQIKNTNKSSTFSSSANTTVKDSNRKLPILLFDIMDTIVRDPFYHHVPAFFGMSMEELIECKHPTAWIEFEKGLIDEVELARKFFKDGKPFDLEGLKNCMRSGYSYVEGVEELLRALKHNNYEIHAFTNYPIWYKMIEDKLEISTYISWTFCSCIHGKRKPDHDFFLEVVRHLKVDPASCIFIDDRIKNVEAAAEIGFIGLHFKNTDLLHQDLSQMGIDISCNQH
ncbi:HAD_2 domain-containing protein [Cephalotus follicularis]|uniref:HAD_2 domain-containing protein n=1 Tax=Cephalotus follicularis TaxID=3775 RepID=A0A1Q3CPE2_CEPFO|nr:HAD_2 domain-containing protein [Cephalotus follicularis]